MSNALRTKATRGVAWNSVNGFTMAAFNFLLQLLLARLLLPSDFGVIGILLVFIAISQIFIEGGFTAALIQNKDRTETDFSTVFLFNLFTSGAMYLLLFVSAPFIANFYENEILSPTLRTLGLILPIAALSAVHQTKMVISLNFCNIFKVNLVAMLISSTVGISSALYGLGIWALVFQYISKSFVTTVAYWFLLRWYPTLAFSKFSFCHMFSFSWKLVASSIINATYKHTTTIAIGGFFSMTELGFYTRAFAFASFPSNLLTGIISSVAFPVFSEVQNDTPRLRHLFFKSLRFATSLAVPSMICLAIVAEPLVVILIGEKWLPSVILLKILCFAWFLDTVTTVNIRLLYAKGKSDWVLNLELFKKPVGLVILFASIPFGLTGVCVGKVVYAFFALGLNMIYSGRILKTSYWSQIKTVIPIYVSSIIAGAIAYPMTILLQNPFLQMGSVIFIMSGLYTLLAWKLRLEIWIEGAIILRKIIAKFKKSNYFQRTV